MARTQIGVGDQFGCLTIIARCPKKEQPGNGHIFFRVKCERCGATKKQRSDRLRKNPSHCGKSSCRTVRGVDILERRDVERELWSTIKEEKKDNPTWHYLWTKFKDDGRWKSTGLLEVNPSTMRKWYYRLGKLLGENK